jgi:hypothetical protein
MSAGVVAFLSALSISVWSYYKLQSHTGYGNTRTTFIGAAVIFAVVFVVVFSVGHMIIK